MEVVYSLVFGILLAHVVLLWILYKNQKRIEERFKFVEKNQDELKNTIHNLCISVFPNINTRIEELRNNQNIMNTNIDWMYNNFMEFNSSHPIVQEPADNTMFSNEIEKVFNEKEKLMRVVNNLEQKEKKKNKFRFIGRQ